MVSRIKVSGRELFTLVSVGLGGAVFFYQLSFGAAKENLTVLAALLSVIIAVTSLCFGAAGAVGGDARFWYLRAGRILFQAGLIMLSALMFQFISVNSGWEWESNLGLFAKLSALHLLVGIIFAMLGLSSLCRALSF